MIQTPIGVLQSQFKYGSYLYIKLSLERQNLIFYILSYVQIKIIMYQQKTQMFAINLNCDYKSHHMIYLFLLIK